MKIHAGCGYKFLPGWVNVDIAVHPKAPRPPDILADVCKIPLPDGCASVLMGIHIFEHVHVWQVDGMLAEWRRLVRPGGKLILEMPDIFKAAKNLLDGKDEQQSMWAIYGDPQMRDPFMGHHWGWTFKTIRPVLERNGFRDAMEWPTVFHRVGKVHRDFRVEAVRA